MRGKGEKREISSNIESKIEQSQAKEPDNNDPQPEGSTAANLRERYLKELRSNTRNITMGLQQDEAS